MLLKQFLEEVPPGTIKNVDDIGDPYGTECYLKTPPIEVECGSEKCGAKRIFRTDDCQDNLLFPTSYHIMKYVCGNCNEFEKNIAIRADPSKNGSVSGCVVKIGEFPAFGDSLHTRIFKLIGQDKDLFLKGRRSENQGFGIGAFAYYRQVVENQKGRFITQIAEVARRLGSDQSLIDLLAAASCEQSFDKSIQMIKDTIPKELYIKEHNPMVLLHRALSQGLHAGTDEECLLLANSIRLVLNGLAERIALTLKDQRELEEAVNRLTNVKRA